MKITGIMVIHDVTVFLSERQKDTLNKLNCQVHDGVLTATAYQQHRIDEIKYIFNDIGLEYEYEGDFHYGVDFMTTNVNIGETK